MCKPKQVHVQLTFTHHTPLSQEHVHNYVQVDTLTVYVTQDGRNIFKVLQPLNT